MEGKGKITMSDITKSRFDELIERKANERVEQILERICDNLPWEIAGNGNESIVFNEKCGELAGKSLFSVNHTFGLINNKSEEVLTKYTDWPEVKEGLLKKYRDEETDDILNRLSGISDFLEERGNFDAGF